MSGKGDARRPTAKSFESNFDKLDWNNDKESEQPKKQFDVEWNEATQTWDVVEKTNE